MTEKQASKDVLVNVKTNRGTMQLKLNADKAPKTVANFLSYLKDGYYNGTIFHRVIPNFMIQGGGFTAEMEQKKTKATVENEGHNGLKNTLGSIAMARTNDPHSATSQFFINLSDNEFLNHRGKSGDQWGYTVFGQLVKGDDVLKAIGQVPTTSSQGHQDVPKEAVVIESITLEMSTATLDATTS